MRPEILQEIDRELLAIAKERNLHLWQMRDVSGHMVAQRISARLPNFDAIKLEQIVADYLTGLFSIVTPEAMRRLEANVEKLAEQESKGQQP